MWGALSISLAQDYWWGLSYLLKQQKKDVFVQVDLDLDTIGILECICSTSSIPALSLRCDNPVSIDTASHLLGVKASLG